MVRDGSFVSEAGFTTASVIGNVEPAEDHLIAILPFKVGASYYSSLLVSASRELLLESGGVGSLCSSSGFGIY